MDHKFTADLTSNQLGKDGTSQYATFLPAVSNAFSSMIGNVRNKPNYFAASRLPVNFEYGLEGLNWLNPTDYYFTYRWNLYSAGHANLDLTKDDPGEAMIRKRDKSYAWILGDSGGYQIAKGQWECDWTAGSGCPKAQKKRDGVLKWLDDISDYAMILDIPTWVVYDEKARKASNIHTYQQAVDATKYNNDYFLANRQGYQNGGAKLLNVMQGANHKDADGWYNIMKHYSDPNKHPGTHFNGWAMGGQNMCDVDLILRRLVALRHDGLLETGIHDHMHFLGTSKLEWATLLTDIQRAVRRHHNPNFSITFDCASPFLAAANGQVYREISLEHRKKWTYRMEGGIDDKKYALDTRSLRDGIMQDGLFKSFEDSPISARCMMKDICTYAPGDLNKIGKEGRTSWDTLSYGILMAHNTYMHAEAVQRANRDYDNGVVPYVLMSSDEDIALWYFRDIIEEIFATSDRQKSLDIIKKHSDVWLGITGSRGFTGRKALNSNTHFNANFVPV